MFRHFFKVRAQDRLMLGSNYYVQRTICHEKQTEMFIINNNQKETMPLSAWNSLYCLLY